MQEALYLLLLVASILTVHITQRRYDAKWRATEAQKNIDSDNRWNKKSRWICTSAPDTFAFAHAHLFFMLSLPFVVICPIWSSLVSVQLQEDKLDVAETFPSQYFALQVRACMLPGK